MPFETNVFINCPFDNDYKKFLDSLLFTVIYCGYNPLISETFDSGSNRLINIVKLIHQSKYSVHDLCRMVAEKKGDVARFNMPFELGIDIGARTSGMKKLKNKACLILDSQRYRYQAALSDIAGNDIEIYDDKIQNLIRIARNWLNFQSDNRMPGPTLVWEEYKEFQVDLEETLLLDGFSKFDINILPKSEYILLAREWVTIRKAN